MTSLEFPMSEAALACAEKGYHIFPIHTMRGDVCSCGGSKNCTPGKHPVGKLVPDGLKNASADAEVIGHWWRQMPDANIGMATGKLSNIVVLDVDGALGEATLAQLQKEHGSLPRTLQVKTGKGRHIYLRYPVGADKVKSIARTKLGLDIRADGGYVLAPPSLHASGHRYTVLDDSPMAECPAWVVDYANGDVKPHSAFGQTAGFDIFKGQKPPALFHGLKPQSLAEGIRQPTSPPPPYSEGEEAVVRAALAFIPAGERDTWRDIGFALHSLGWGEKGFQIWTDWARTCPDKFDAADQEKTWESFDRPYNGPRISIGTLFHKAREEGWVDNTQHIEFRTDLGNAKRLVARHGDDIRYVPEWRKWLIWRNERWEIDGDGEIMRRAKETVEAMYSEAMALSGAERDALLRHAMASQGAKRLNEMIKLAETEARVVVAAHTLDADPWVLGVQNGVIELKTGQFRAARRDDLITKRAGVAFDPNASCPEWLKFLETITGGDGDLQKYMQRFSGYTLTGVVSEEVMLVLYGTGNNGKSTYRETLHAMLGDYALAADAGLLTEKKKAGGATEEIARLRGCRLVAVNETAENDHLNEARIKFITSQDTISARNLYGHLFDFFPTHKTVLTTNHKPIVKGTDAGIWRRVHLLPFIVTIPNVEKDFRERRLMPELPGILNWALAGLVEYLRQGLNPPPSVLAATREYRNDMDVIGQWLDERCVIDPQVSIETSLAYGDYSRWAEEEVGWCLGKLAFRRNLADRGFGPKKGSGGKRMVQGLRLQPLTFTQQQPRATATVAAPVPQTAADVDEPEGSDIERDTQLASILAQAGPTAATGPWLHSGLTGATGSQLH